MSLISSPKLIIFDCDGVLVDSEPMSIGALKDLFSEHNLELTYEEVASRFKGRSLIDTRHSLRTYFNIELRDEAVDRMHQGLLEKFKTDLRQVPGVEEFISLLTQPYCVASSGDPSRIKCALQSTGLDSYFGNRLFSATQVKLGKPEPDLFLHAARECSASPSECLVIEDSPAGVLAAKRAGMMCVGIAADSYPRTSEDVKKLSASGADIVVNSYAALARIIEAVA
jgi:HAD superfamily hydrolase (TIGR01509 family)